MLWVFEKVYVYSMSDVLCFSVFDGKHGIAGCVGSHE